MESEVGEAPWGRAAGCRGAGGAVGLGQRAGSLRTEPESGRSSWSQGEAEKGAREEQKEEGVEGEPSQRAVRVWVGYRDPCTSNIPSGAWAPARHSCPAQRGWESVPAPWGGGAGPAHSTVAPGTRTARPLGPRGCLSLFTCLPSRGPCCWGLLGCLGRRGGRQAGRRGRLIPDLQEPGAGQRAPQGAWPDPPLTPPGLGAVQITSGSLPVSSSSPAQQVQILGQLEGEGEEEGGILVE